MSIVDYLYRGAPAGERAAVQTAVKNTPYSTIGKNIIAEGAFGKGSNLRGFDPNFKGGTNLFNYVKGGISSLFGGKAPGNIGGGTPAQRQLFEKVLQSPITRTVGPVVRSALSLPMTLAASGPYAISKLMEPRTEAGFNYMKGFDEGAITSIADAENAFDFQQFGNELLAVDAANQAPVNQGSIIDATPVGFASQMNAERNVGVPQDNRFTGIMRNIARGPLFQGGATAGLRLGEIITGAPSLPFALAGGIASQFLPLDRRPSNLDYQYVNQPGGVNVVDNKITTGVLSGKNFASGFGSNNLGTMYQDYIDTMTGRGMVTDEFGNLVFDEEELTDNQKQKLKDAKAELNAYLTTGSKIRGYRDSVRGRTMTPREFAFNYNQGIGQFAQPDYDKLDTQSYTGSTESGGLGGGEFTDSMGNVDYSDPYDPGGGE
jgi:hypothetical protein